MSERRVVITGMGLITPVGNDTETFWKNLVNGVSGIGPVTTFDVSRYDAKIGGEVKNFDPKAWFNNPRDARRADRYAQLGMAAAKMALADSGLDLDKIDRQDIGVLVGSGIGGLASISEQHGNLVRKGPERVSPFMIPMMIANIASGLIAIEYGFQGPNFSVVTACATSNNTIGEAWRMIRDNEVSMFLAGGSEAAVVELGLSGFGNMKALSTRNDAPEKASRPFDRDRDGFVTSEGAGVLLIEELEHAKARGARIYCELVGYGLTCDAYHMTSPLPEGEGAARAMTNALKRARLNPEDVDYVNAHATSTPVGDICEAKAIKSVFGPHAAAGLPVSSTKSMTGHLLGAAGAVELAACVLAIRDGIIPPTINLDNQDPACELNCVPHTAIERQVNVAVSNSFGFGGHNATLVVKRFTN